MIQEPDIASAVIDQGPSATVVAAEPPTQKETAQPNPVAKQSLSPYTV